MTSLGRRRWVLGLVAALGSGGCNRAFYFPSSQTLGVPHVKHDDVALRTSDGVELHGWLFPPLDGGPPKATVVQFHGNAGNVSSHFLSLVWVIRHGYAFFTFDYRGYGRSGGQPSPAGLHADALAAMGWVNAHAPRGAEPRDVVLYGQSLGGAVLLDALKDIDDRRRIRAVVVEGSFHSYEEVAASMLWREPVLFPFAGLGYALVSDEHAPARSVAGLSPLPLLVIHDTRDPVVPVRFGSALYRNARQPKTFWVTDTGQHIRATADPAVRAALLAWLERPPQ